MWKVSPSFSVRPKVFWSSFIILLIVSVTLYMLKEEEKTLRINTQKQLAETIREKRAIENEFTITLRAKEILQEELSAEIEKSLALAKEVEEKKDQIKLALDKLEKEIIARRAAEMQLILAAKEKRSLKMKLREVTEVPRTVALEKIVVKAVPVLAGNVLIVNKEYAFIVVNLGRVDNLRIGDVLSVYRSGEFIGRVQVEKVEEKISAAAIMSEWRDVEFKENDEVMEI